MIHSRALMSVFRMRIKNTLGCRFMNSFRSAFGAGFTIPANPKPWDVNSVYDAEGFYVSHKGKVWVSQWYITRGREPGANAWNGWKETGPVIDPVPAAKPTWAAVSARGSCTLAINSRGELYAWGWNHNGKLGDGTTTNRSTPTRIGSDSDWGRLSQGGNHSMAVKTNGELYAWWPNDEGTAGGRHDRPGIITG